MSLLPQPTGAGEAIVLRAWPSGETSAIASVLTAEHGDLRLLAKGARRQASALRPLVRPGLLTALEYGLAPGRDLQYLRGGAVLLDPLAGGGLERTAYLLAAVEMVDRCRPGGTRGGRLFAHCRAYLAMLSSAAPGAEAPLFFAFELGLLRLQGVAPILDACAGCGGEVADDGRAGFGPESGGLLCARCLAAGAVGWRLTPGTAGALAALAGPEPSAAVAALADPARRRQVGVALHRFLERHLPGYRLPSALDLLRRPAAADRPGEPSRGESG